MEDEDLVEAEAAKLVTRHDGKASERAIDAAEVAAERGDQFSAETWRGVADKAAELEKAQMPGTGC